jgi:hypothetical protein
MEQNAALFWTPDLAKRFHDLAGYSINTFLPGLFSMANTWNGMFPPYLSVYTYGNTTTTGESVHQLDYRRALNSGYQEYLAHFREWAHSRGFEFSTQPAYNLPLEMVKPPLLYSALRLSASDTVSDIFAPDTAGRHRWC